MPASTPNTGPPTRVASAAAASDATAVPGSGAPTRRLGLALAVIATAQLMVVLDGTIVNVALPHIQTALGFSDSNLAWIVNVYALVFGGLLLLGGRSGDLLGRRRIFITGLLVFAGASLLGGFATDQAWLLAARALQGVGGALASPAVLALVVGSFPEGRERTRALSIYSAVAMGGALNNAASTNGFIAALSRFPWLDLTLSILLRATVSLRGQTSVWPVPHDASRGRGDF